MCATGRLRQPALANSNMKLRRLDLASELVGTIGFSWTLAAFGSFRTLLAFVGLTCAALPFQLMCIRKVKAPLPPPTPQPPQGSLLRGHMELDVLKQSGHLARDQNKRFRGFYVLISCKAAWPAFLLVCLIGWWMHATAGLRGHRSCLNSKALCSPIRAPSRGMQETIAVLAAAALTASKMRCKAPSLVST